MTTIERDHYESRESWEWALRDQIDREEQQILKALKDIDRAREKLILAQNNLANIVRAADDITREMFGKFYRAGGVTAEDWEIDLDTGQYHRAERTSRGPLRLISFKTERGATARDTRRRS